MADILRNALSDFLDALDPRRTGGHKVVNYETKISQLRQEIQRLEDKWHNHPDFARSIDDLLAQISYLESSLQQSPAKAGEMIEQLQKQEENLAQEHSRLQLLVESGLKLQTKVARFQKLRELQALGNLNHSVELQTQSQMQAQHDTLQTQIAELEQQIESARTEFDLFIKKRKQLLLEIMALIEMPLTDENAEDLQEVIESRITELQKENQALQKEIDALEEQRKEREHYNRPQIRDLHLWQQEMRQLGQMVMDHQDAYDLIFALITDVNYLRRKKAPPQKGE